MSNKTTIGRGHRKDVVGYVRKYAHLIPGRFDMRFLTKAVAIKLAKEIDAKRGAMSSEVPDPIRARQFASDVADAMYKMRGYTLSSAPSEVRSDVFATMARHDSIYSHGFATGRPGHLVGRDIQTAEWEAQ